MKRNCTLFALFCCLTLTTAALQARPMMASCAAEQTELPWSTVTAILHQVEDHVNFTYNELVDMYAIGRVTIDVVSEGYSVVVMNADGSTDTVLIANL